MARLVRVIRLLLFNCILLIRAREAYGYKWYYLGIFVVDALLILFLYAADNDFTFTVSIN